MKNKTIYLGIFVGEYGKDEEHFKVLFKADKLAYFDQYTMQFKNRDEIWNEYQNEISEFFLDEMEVIKKNETKNHKFKGRISAFYYNENGKKEFIEISYQDKRIVRDYCEFKLLKDRLSFILEVFDVTAFDLIKRRKQKKTLNSHNMAHITMNILKRYNYLFSKNEIYYLVKYFNNPCEQNLNDCHNLLRQNIKKKFENDKLDDEEKREIDKDLKRIQEEKNNIDKIEVSDDLPSFFAYILNKDDDDLLFRNIDLDEIEKYSNKLEKRGK